MQHAYINNESTSGSNYINPCNFYNTQMYSSGSLYPASGMYLYCLYYNIIDKIILIKNVRNFC